MHVYTVQFRVLLFEILHDVSRLSASVETGVEIT